jgi:phospholipid N-methyltransferase
MSTWLAMTGVAARSDRSMFLRSWLRNPLQVGAILPSSRALADLMTQEIPAIRGPIVELGAGTGVFTHALIRRGVPVHRLALVEANPEFARGLVFRFPQARVLRMDAVDIKQVDSFFGGERVGAFLSGLPLRSMPAECVFEILDGAFHRHLRRDGVFYQFTYLPRCPVSAYALERLGLCAERIGWVASNLPPAFVYRLSRKN